MSSLGIAVLFIGTLLGIKNIVVIITLFITGYFLCGFLINGYKFRIIKTSLGGLAELPVFNNWIEMFVDGIKVSIVVVVYLLPTILIMAFAALTILPLLGISGIKSIPFRHQNNFKPSKCNPFGSFRNFIHDHNPAQ